MNKDLTIALATVIANLAVFLASAWLMMIVLGWLGIVGITYGKALVIVLLIDFLKTNNK
jgi:hypothetical protein